MKYVHGECSETEGEKAREFGEGGEVSGPREREGEFSAAWRDEVRHGSRSREDREIQSDRLWR